MMKFKSRQAPRLSPVEAAQARALRGQRVKLSFPYYSKIRHNFARTGAAGGPYTYTVAAGNAPRAFSYAIGEVPSLAGFPAAFGAATGAETNLLNRNETNNGEDVMVSGIGASLGATTDGRLAALVYDNAFVDLVMNGDQTRLRLGLLGHLPGGAGLVGLGTDSLGVQPLGGGRPQFGAVQNGWAVRSNCQRIPDGLTWRGKATADSNMNLVCTVGRALTVTTPVDEPGGAGVRGYVYPADGAAFVDVIFELRGFSTRGRSNII